MKNSFKLLNEKQRLDSLQSLGLLDTLPEKDFDEITSLAAHICDVPRAMICLVDKERLWFKSQVGLNFTTVPRENSFCSYTIEQKGVFIIPNAPKDDRFVDSFLVKESPKIRFYAGAPLFSPDGFILGTVCVMDSKPRTLNETQLLALTALSNQVTRLIQLKTQIAELVDSKQVLLFKKTAIDSISEGVVLLNKEGQIIDFNPAALEVLGLTADELTGKTSLDPHWRAIREDGSAFPGEDHPSVVSLRTGNKQTNVVIGVHRPPDQVRWLRVSSVPLFLPGAKLPYQVVTSFADITEQLQMNSEILRTQESLKIILHGVPSMIGHWSSEVINLNANSAYTTYFNKTPEEIRGKHMKEIIGEKLFEQNLPFIKDVLSGKKLHFERDVLTFEGKPKSIVVSYVPIFEHNVVTSFLAVVTDITDIKNLEKERHHLELQLAESARLSTLGEMAAGIAHEINNPLAIIQAKSTLLRKKLNSGAIDTTIGTEHLVVIENTIERIVKIIRGLQTYSRSAENDPFEKANFSKILHESLLLCEERFKNKSVRVSILCEPDINVECRPAQISQLIMNLMTNSLDAISSLSEKWIDLRVTMDTDHVKLVFSDSGNGIPKPVAAKIMEPFFTTKGVGKGTGLGLSISKSIADIHGGTFRYDETAKHTTFVLDLPLVHTKKLKSAS